MYCGYNYGWPYTNSDRYNDDWLIKTVVDLCTQWKKVSADWDKMQTDFESLKSFVLDYFKGLDLYEEVSRKIDSMAADGTLAEILGGDVLVADRAFPYRKTINPEKLFVLDNGGYVKFGGCCVDSTNGYIYACHRTSDTADMHISRYSLTTGELDKRVSMKANMYLSHQNSLSIVNGNLVVSICQETSSPTWSYAIYDTDLNFLKLSPSGRSVSCSAYNTKLCTVDDLTYTNTIWDSRGNSAYQAVYQFRPEPENLMVYQNTQILKLDALCLFSGTPNISLTRGKAVIKQYSHCGQLANRFEFIVSEEIEAIYLDERTGYLYLFGIDGQVFRVVGFRSLATVPSYFFSSSQIPTMPPQFSPVDRNGNLIYTDFSIHCGSLSNSDFTAPYSNGVVMVKSAVSGDSGYVPVGYCLLNLVRARGSAIITGEQITGSDYRLVAINISWGGIGGGSYELTRVQGFGIDASGVKHDVNANNYVSVIGRPLAVNFGNICDHCIPTNYF